MMAELVSFSVAALHGLAAASLKGAISALVVLGLTLALRRWLAPRWRHLLWVLVFARLLLPDVAAWKWSVQRWSQESPVPAAVERAAGLPLAQGGLPVPLSPEAAALTKPLSVAAGAPALLSLGEMAGLVWLAGSLVMLTAMLVCGLQFRRRVLRHAVLADASWTRLAEELGMERGWRRVPRVFVSPCITGPVLAGLWRPRVILPASGAVEGLEQAQRRHLLLHELAHWRRADLWVRTAASLLLAAHWFNPLMWLAQRRLRMESEACADACVLRWQGPAEAREYGGTLLHLVTQSAALGSLLFLPAVLGMAGGGELRERLTELAQGRRRKRFWTLGALVVMGLAGAVTLTHPLAAEPKPKPVPASTSSEKVIVLKHASPDEVIKELKEIYPAGKGPSIQTEAREKEHAVLIKASPGDLANLEQLVAELDQSPGANTFHRWRLRHLPAATALARVAEAIEAKQHQPKPHSVPDVRDGIPVSLVIGKNLLIACPADNQLLISGLADDVQLVGGLIERLDKAAGIHGRVVDPHGKPVPGAQVSLRPDPSHPAGRIVVMKSGADGTFRYDEFFQGEPVTLSCQHEGYVIPLPVEAHAGSPDEVRLVLQPAKLISGTVISAEDGRPVANARVYLGRTDTHSFAWNGGTPVITDVEGHYKTALRFADAKPSMVRVESDRHATFISAPVVFKEANNQMDATLQPLRLLEGTVLAPDGAAASGVVVWLAEGSLDVHTPVTPEWMQAKLDRMDERPGCSFNKAKTDASGRFQIKEPHPFLVPNGFLAAASPAGLGRVSLEKFHKTGTFSLERWNTLKARVVSADGRPVANHKASILCDGTADAASGLKVTPQRSLSGITDGEGRIVFDQVLPHSSVQLELEPRQPLVGNPTLPFAVGETREQVFILAPAPATLPR